MIEVDGSTITNWEKNRTSPTLRCIPRIVEFLGYAPEMESNMTLGQRMVLYRRLHGFNQERMAKQLGVDQTTIGRWERDETKPIGKLLSIVENSVKGFEIRQTF